MRIVYATRTGFQLRGTVCIVKAVSVKHAEFKIDLCTPVVLLLIFLDQLKLQVKKLKDFLVVAFGHVDAARRIETLCALVAFANRLLIKLDRHVCVLKPEFENLPENVQKSALLFGRTLCIRSIGKDFNEPLPIR